MPLARCSPCPTGSSPGRGRTGRGAVAVEVLTAAGFDVVERRVVADGVDSVAAVLRDLTAVRRARRHDRRHRASVPATSPRRAPPRCSSARRPASPRRCGWLPARPPVPPSGPGRSATALVLNLPGSLQRRARVPRRRPRRRPPRPRPPRRRPPPLSDSASDALKNARHGRLGERAVRERRCRRLGL